MVYVPPDPPATPYLMVGNGHRALDWYVRAFGAREVDRYDMEDGRLGHAMLTLANGGSIYVADEFPEMIGTIGTLAPDSLGGTTVTVALAVDDADEWWTRAILAGAVPVFPLADQFWGDRYGQLKDPFGHSWSIGGPIKAS